MPAKEGKPTKARKRRRYPIGQLLAGPRTIDTDRGPVIIDTENERGRLWVRVELPCCDAGKVDVPPDNG